MFKFQFTVGGEGSEPQHLKLTPMRQSTRLMPAEFTHSRGTSGKEPSANAGDVRNTGLIPGSGRSPGGKNGNPL